VPTLQAERTFYSRAHIFHPLSWMSALDIDDEDDLEMARACFAVRERRDGR
jgi:CMP-N-acetylneuraminic acid synthetase